MKTDFAGLMHLWNANCAFDTLGSKLFKEKTIGDSDFDADLLVVSGQSDSPDAFGFAVIRSGEEKKVGHIKMFVVDQSVRFQGIGSVLLADLESRLIGRGVSSIRIGEGAPNYLVPGLDPRYTGAMVFFERRGYERIGETWNLTVDLSELSEVPEAPGGYEIRRAVGTDREDVMAFLETRWKAWIPEISNAFGNDPISLHVALCNGQVVAFSGYDCNNVGTGWFGPMGTDESARGSGLGSILLLRCLDDLKRQGLAEATIPWVGPIGFYSRYAGAVVSRTFYRYEKVVG